MGKCQKWHSQTTNQIIIVPLSSSSSSLSLSLSPLLSHYHYHHYDYHYILLVNVCYIMKKSPSNHLLWEYPHIAWEEFLRFELGRSSKMLDAPKALWRILLIVHGKEQQPIFLIPGNAVGSI